MAAGIGINLKLVDDTPLDEDDDFADLREAALPVAARWHDVGTAMRLRLSDLDTIMAASSSFPENCLTQVLTNWLRKRYKVEKFGPPTWRKLVEVIAIDAGGKNPALAQTIASQHPVQGTQPDAPRVKPVSESPPTQPQEHSNGAAGVPPYVSFFPTDGTKAVMTDGGGNKKEYDRYEPFPREKKTKSLLLSFGRVDIKSEKKHKGLDSYDMKRFPHGIAVIINNEEFERQAEREGTAIDEGNLIQTLRLLGYIVEVHRNRHAGQILDIFQSVKERDHGAYDSFICCILTHGKEGQIYGSDSERVELSDITSRLTGSSCVTLTGKPKMFFIQACRGKGKEESVRVKPDDARMEPDSDPLELPDQADFFFGYATPLGNVAWRDLDHGSWYVSELSRILVQHSSHSDLNHMITEVNKKVGEYKFDKFRQTAEFTSRLRKDVFFF